MTGIPGIRPPIIDNPVMVIVTEDLYRRAPVCYYIRLQRTVSLCPALFFFNSFFSGHISFGVL